MLDGYPNRLCLFKRRITILPTDPCPADTCRITPTYRYLCSPAKCAASARVGRQCLPGQPPTLFWGPILAIFLKKTGPKACQKLPRLPADPLFWPYSGNFTKENRSESLPKAAPLWDPPSPGSSRYLLGPSWLLPGASWSRRGSSWAPSGSSLAPHRHIEGTRGPFSNITQGQRELLNRIYEAVAAVALESRLGHWSLSA